MINYIEKGHGLHVAINAAGHWLAQRDDEWASSDDEAVQAIIDAYTLDQAANEVKAKIEAHAATLRNKVTAAVSPAEMASWAIKQIEGAKYAASGNESDAPMLSMEAAARGVSLAELVAKVAGNASGLSMLEAQIAGIGGKHRDAVSALTTFADALAYDWSAGWPEI